MSAAYLAGPPAAPVKARYSCDGKVRYGSWDAANRIARETIKVVLQPYRCRVCHGYHIGGMPPGVIKGDRIKNKVSDNGKRRTV